MGAFSDFKKGFGDLFSKRGRETVKSGIKETGDALTKPTTIIPPDLTELPTIPDLVEEAQTQAGIDLKKKRQSITLGQGTQGRLLTPRRSIPNLLG